MRSQNRLLPLVEALVALPLPLVLPPTVLFVVQPLAAAFVNMGNKELEAAAILGLGSLKRFFHIILPMTLPCFVMAAALGFADLLGQPAHALSGGQHQRVALGWALLAEPDLLLDEPFSALDRHSRIHQAHVLKGLQHESGIPMIFVSHAMEKVSLLCDQLVLLESGRDQA